MIISENKPINEILGFLKNAEKVVLIGCNQCAAICKSGGEEEVLKMKEAGGRNWLIGLWRGNDEPSLFSYLFV